VRHITEEEMYDEEIEAVNSPGIVGFNIVGSCDPGTIDLGDSGKSFNVSFTLSFTQTPVDTGSISDSSTFSVNADSPPGVPEPATLVLGLTSVVGGGLLFRLRRRQRARKAAR
jgi:hypothetical protein